jgi:hypothetical protein
LGLPAKKSNLLLLFCLSMYLTSAQQPSILKIYDESKPGTAVQLTGFVGEKLDAAYNNRILAQNVDRLIQPFKNRTEESCWQSEFWGKWFTSAEQAYQYRTDPKLKAIIDSAVTKLIATQTPDGYIGNYTDAKHLEQWDIWGRKYCMLGLLSYYDLTHDRNSLQATRRIADYLRNWQTSRCTLFKKGITAVWQQVPYWSPLRFCMHVREISGIWTLLKKSFASGNLAWSRN